MADTTKQPPGEGESGTGGDELTPPGEISTGTGGDELTQASEISTGTGGDGHLSAEQASRGGSEHAHEEHRLSRLPHIHISRVASARNVHEEEMPAAWGWPSSEEPRWPATLAVAAAVGLQLVLPSKVTHFLGPRWLPPAVEGLIGVSVFVFSPKRISRESTGVRLVAICLIALVSVANLASLVELLDALLYGNKIGGRALIAASIPVWLTNVIVFGLWYWELDRGGPARRLSPEHRRPDFLFPQMSTPGAAEQGWAPGFLDYLYTSFTNATAFSPTDTMPLTPSAKALMAAQSVVSLLTVAIVVSRAVNILN